MMEFMHDDLPDPVAPEMRMCGISARLAMTARPAMSRPMATSSGWRCRVRPRRLEDVAQRDELAGPVRHLDADGRLARDGREDAHVGRRHGVGDVLGEAGDPGDLDAGAELDLVTGHRRAHPAPHEAGLDAVRGQRAHQLLAGGVDLTLVLAHLLRLRASEAHVGQHPLAGRPRRRGGAGSGHGSRSSGSGPGSGSGSGSSGMSMSVSSSAPRRFVGQVAAPRRTGSSGEAASPGSRRDSGDDDEWLALPQTDRAWPAAHGAGAQAPADRGERGTGRHQDRHQDDGDQQHGGAGRTEAGMERAADHRAEIAPGAGAVRCDPRRRGAPLASSARPHTPSSPRTVPTPRRHGSAPSPSSSSSAGRRSTTARPCADGDQRQDDAGPARQERQPRVGTVTDRAELLAPQRQRQEDTERDQADGPQVPGLDAPERRPLDRRWAAAWRTRCRLLGGGAGGRARVGARCGSWSPQ